MPDLCKLCSKHDISGPFSDVVTYLHGKVAAVWDR